MSDALPLPARPNLEHYKKRAKDLVKICKAGDADALRAWLKDWIESLIRLRRDEHRPYTPAEIGSLIQRAFDRITQHLTAADQPQRGACTLARAQFVLAREHGFASWPKFARHLGELARARSPVSVFEDAADAIVNGDLAALEKLLSENPALVRARSMREHRSTLLHYVSANGAEDFRQKTPKNIVEITQRLLQAGADVNAESDAYAGRSTTLGLTATSYHPQAAGVQLPLLELLIEQGALIDAREEGNAVNGCLRNGRGEAAEFLARCGARLDLEGAAGVGRLNVVTGFFGDDGSLKPPATQNQLQAGFARACEFGRTDVVDFLLQRGMEVDAKLNQHGGETGLHWAAYGGHVEIVRLLLERGAPVDVKDKCHDGTPLDWALHEWANSANKPDREKYYEVVALLGRAGAKLDPAWHDAVVNRHLGGKKIQADPRMQAALRGQMPAP